MRVPVLLAARVLRPRLSAEELAERLAMTGPRSSGSRTSAPPSRDGFVVGRVLSVEQHPDADRLSVCAVDDRRRRPRTIVCGAPNVAAGQTVAGGAARAR